MSDEYGLLRLSWKLDTDNFLSWVNSLVEARHFNKWEQVDISQAPQVVSCITAIRYLVQRSFQIDIPEMTLENLPKLPRILTQLPYEAKLVKLWEVQMGDLVFYHGPHIYEPDFLCINHIGIMLNSEDFYHSTRTDHGFTVSNLQAKITEEKVATIQQIMEVINTN